MQYCIEKAISIFVKGREDATNKKQIYEMVGL